jgi:hypothetical protein
MLFIIPGAFMAWRLVRVLAASALFVDAPTAVSNGIVGWKRQQRSWSWLVHRRGGLGRRVGLPQPWLFLFREQLGARNVAHSGRRRHSSSGRFTHFVLVQWFCVRHGRFQLLALRMPGLRRAAPRSVVQASYALQHRRILRQHDCLWSSLSKICTSQPWACATDPGDTPLTVAAAFPDALDRSSVAQGDPCGCKFCTSD